MDAATEVFDQHRALLFSMAYQVLGSAADAEDAVQDAWVKWSAADRAAVAAAKPYLVRIVTNLAMDRLRSAQARREVYVGPWLPEPIRTDAAAHVEHADSLSTALLVLLESLSPLERAVFVLKEAFDFSYAEIAAAVDRSEDTVRKAAQRARAHVRARRPRFRADHARRQQAATSFVAAAAGGDINALMELLAPDVTLWTDGGGKVRQVLHPVLGAERIAAAFRTMGRTTYEGVDPADVTVEVAELNGGPALVFHAPDRVMATVTFDFDADGRISTIHNIANPDKLHAVQTGTVHAIR